MSEQWKSVLQDRIESDLAKEIDVFETQIEMRRKGKLEEKLFAETRLRRGVYGQRYDNGLRHDGNAHQRLGFPESPTKGPDTDWHAPGMMRIKIPFGGLNAEQIDVLAACSEEYADGVSHITTRQDIQFHFVHIEDTPDMMRRLGAVGITTREACGNSVRNVTACPIAGVCNTESFDVTPYAHALTYYLLGHRDVQDFGRKFKVAFSGCAGEACGVVALHDLGYIAKMQDGERGFEVWVGGGLGAVPHQAKLFADFIPEAELLPVAQAICRVYARLGEKKSRVRARIKFLVAKLGIEEFQRLCAEERAALPEDDRWSLEDVESRWQETPLKDPAELPGDAELPEGYAEWAATNVYPQKQPGYVTITASCPLGDLSANQMRAIADIARTYVNDTVRLTVEQNFVLRWVAAADAPKVYEALKAIDLGEAGAGTIVDVTACPGTDTCKLGISSSRGLARTLRTHLAEKSMHTEEAVKGLRIKISGCFNSCGQHHVSDLGFYGISRTKAGYAVPHFQVVLGGKWKDNGGSYGLAVGAVPSKNIPGVVDRITTAYIDQRDGAESFQDFIQRIGKKKAKEIFLDLMQIPAYDEQPSFYQDWGDPRVYSTSDLGVGECAGEVVSLTEFDLGDAERCHFEAQEKLETGDAGDAAKLAYDAMVYAARALVKTINIDVPYDAAKIVEQFKREFYDTQVFFDRYAGGKFADYLLRAHENPPNGGAVQQEDAHRAIEEAQLFIDAAHACYGRVSGAVPS